MKHRFLLSCLVLLSVSAHAQTPQSILQSASVVWNMDKPNATNNQAPITLSGNVTLGQTMQGADREASLKRGGDGISANFNNGHLNVGQAGQITGDQMTLLLRLRPANLPLPNGELFSTPGGHGRLAYNLFSHNGDIGFEIATEQSARLAGNVRIPARALRANTWQDVVARYDGKRLSIFLNGQHIASANVSGNLRPNTLPVAIGRAMRGDIDIAALWNKALSDKEIVALSGGEESLVDNSARRAEIERRTGKDGLTTVDQLRAARELRAKLGADPHRPRYHLMPPDGYWNDVNGTLFWKGRYHVMFLGREAPDAQTVLDGKDTENPREIWLHASSADLVHWVHHTPALTPVFDGSMPRGIYSGGAVAGAEVPTLIYHVPNQGTFIATAANPEDPELVEWIPSPHNPVISDKTQPKEVRVFDPAAWREDDGTYYALVGNKNRTPGYEGDSTSLYRSTDLVNWEYRGPFYKSDRKWTPESADAACPDFFPIGNGKHMLLMHLHNPLYKAHYYIGTWDRANEKFIPEQYGEMTWPGGSLAAPETLLDDQGRRIFWGWIRDYNRQSDAWGSMTTLPRILSLDKDNTLLIQPVPELEALRHNERSLANLSVSGEQKLDIKGGDTIEIRAKILPGKARQFGIIIRQSENGEEQTPILFDLDANTVRIDLSKSSLNPRIKYPAVTSRSLRDKLPDSERFATEQVAPFTLKEGEAIDLRVFIDKSVVEIFVNDRQCITQLIYPTRTDATGIALTADAPITVENLQVWDMHPTH